jgi:hypothetical protein
MPSGRNGAMALHGKSLALSISPACPPPAFAFSCSLLHLSPCFLHASRPSLSIPVSHSPAHGGGTNGGGKNKTKIINLLSPVCPGNPAKMWGGFPGFRSHQDSTNLRLPIFSWPSHQCHPRVQANDSPCLRCLPDRRFFLPDSAKCSTLAKTHRRPRKVWHQEAPNPNESPEEN